MYFHLFIYTWPLPWMYSPWCWRAIEKLNNKQLLIFSLSLGVYIDRFCSFRLWPWDGRTLMLVSKYWYEIFCTNVCTFGTFCLHFCLKKPNIFCLSHHLVYFCVYRGLWPRVSSSLWKAEPRAAESAVCYWPATLQQRAVVPQVLWSAIHLTWL